MYIMFDNHHIFKFLSHNYVISYSLFFLGAICTSTAVVPAFSVSAGNWFAMSPLVVNTDN